MELINQNNANLALKPPQKSMIQIVRMTPAEQEYWNKRNPLKGYRQPEIEDLSVRINAAIAHVESLIQFRLKLGQKYFTERSNYPDLLEFRQQIKAHFNQQGVDLAIHRGGYIFVKDVWQSFEK